MTETLVTTELVDAVYVVSVRGEIDMANADLLADSLRDPSSGKAGKVIVDLDACEFLDSSALNVLARAHHELDSLWLVTSNPNLRRTIELTALDRVFRIAPERASAVNG